MMTDLRSMLHEAAGPLGDPPDSRFADALVLRGQRALRRRRVGRLSTGSGIAAVAFAVLSGTMILVGQQGRASTELVAYTGKQPVGFILDKVPEHWHVESIDTGHLTLAPNDMKGASKDPRELEGKIDVSLTLNVPTVSGVNVQIDGQPGVIYENTRVDYEPADTPATRTLLVKQQSARRSVLPACDKAQEGTMKKNDTDPKFSPCGTAPRDAYLSVQVWGGLGWSTERIIDFANGIHVTKDSTAGVG
jgi:hypothetical protein